MTTALWRYDVRGRRSQSRANTAVHTTSGSIRAFCDRGNVFVKPCALLLHLLGIRRDVDLLQNLAFQVHASLVIRRLSEQPLE